MVHFAIHTLPALEEALLDPELIEHLLHRLIDDIVQCLRLVIEGRNGVSTTPPASVTSIISRMWVRFSWNNSQSSTIALTTGTDRVILGTQQATLVGTVTSGEFAGDAVTIVYLYPTLNPLVCGTSQGVTSQSGTVTVEIIGT